MISQDRIQAILDRLVEYTDGGATCALPMRWFSRALEQTSLLGGLAEGAVEIGVRGGGLSAMFCEIAKLEAPLQFKVMSVDPWGGAPYFAPSPAYQFVYDEAWYVKAKAVLAGYENSILFCMTAESFVTSVLPSFRWWHKGIEHPGHKRFLSFAYLDGCHENTFVMQEALGVLPYMLPGAVLAVDNADYCIEAVAMLSASRRYKLECFENGGDPHRAAFTFTL